jgi:hypothetical protein
VRLDSPQVFLPTDVLAVDLAQIGYEEGIFFSYATGILVKLSTRFFRAPPINCFAL